jgi:hypothetical protein
MTNISDAFYLEMQQVSNELHTEYAQGTVTLTRITRAAADPNSPWLPGLPTEMVYRLESVVEGVNKSHIDGAVILAGDLEVQCAVLATNEAGAKVNIEPRMDDVLRIGDRPHQIKKIEAGPASGIPVYFLIFVAG